MAVCEFGAIKGILYKEKSVPQEIMATCICEFGVIKGAIGRGRTVYQKYIISLKTSFSTPLYIRHSLSLTIPPFLKITI